jgi:hypothetical protein
MNATHAQSVKASLQNIVQKSDEMLAIMKSADFPGQYCGRDSSQETGASQRANAATDAAFQSGSKVDHAAAAAANLAAVDAHKKAGNKGAADKHQALADIHNTKAT